MCDAPALPGRRVARSLIAMIPQRAGHHEVQMMKLGETVSAALVMAALLAALSGCQKQEGPAEHAGKEVDKAVEKAGQQIEKAGASIQDTAKGDKQDEK